MRPVNLIPADECRGDRAAGRTGTSSYILIGLLALVLVGVTATVIFSKRVSDREAEVAVLESEVAATQAQADQLSSFATFQQIRDARVATIDSLAKSRFDWERVMREFSILVPDGVWLTNLTGTATPGVQVTNAAGIGQRAEVPGPALELIGCARNQRTVARLIASIQDIDGVTRVLVPTSIKPESDVTAPASSDSVDPGSSDECATRASIPKFELVAAFDGVPVPASASTAPAPEATPTVPPEPGAADPTTDGDAAPPAESSPQQQETGTARQNAGPGSGDGG